MTNSIHLYNPSKILLLNICLGNIWWGIPWRTQLRMFLFIADVVWFVIEWQEIIYRKKVIKAIWLSQFSQLTSRRRAYSIPLTHKRLEMHGCVISTASTVALVLKHQAISSHSAEKNIQCSGPVSHQNITFAVETWENKKHSESANLCHA